MYKYTVQVVHLAGIKFDDLEEMMFWQTFSLENCLNIILNHKVTNIGDELNLAIKDNFGWLPN